MSTIRSDADGLLVTCSSCSKTNRIPYARLHEKAVCGSCGHSIAPVSSPVEITTASAYSRLISDSKLPILIDFWAAWCGPCRMVAPEMEKVASTEAGNLIVAKIDTEGASTSALAASLDIRSIPLMIVYADGREAARSAGARPASAIREFVWQSIK